MEENMKKISVSIAVLLSAIMIFCMIPVSVSAAWDGISVATSYTAGTGTETDPFIISTESELALLAAECLDTNNAGNSGKFYKLSGDLDLGEKNWAPIGISSGTAFAGTFDGDGHTIRGLCIDTSENYAGLFGYVKNGTVKNLDVEAGTIKSAKYVGVVVGQLAVTAAEGNYAVVENCHVTAELLDAVQIGGVVSRASTTGATPDQMRITGCSAEITGIATTGEFAGGIVGAAGSCVISYCTVTNSKLITGGERGSSSFITVGGIVACQGASSAAAHIYNCCVDNVELGIYEGSTGKEFEVGGLVGRAAHTDMMSEIKNCFVGKVTMSNPTAPDYVGSLAGVAKYMLLYNNCYVCSEPTIGMNPAMIEYPVKVVTAEQAGAVDALTTINLNLGNSNEIWEASAIDGHPVLNLDKCWTNVFTLGDYTEDLPAESSTAAAASSEPAAASSEPAATSAEPAAASSEPADTTAAPADSTAAPAETTAAAPGGCGSSVAIACVSLVAILGTAVSFKRK